MSWTRRCFSEWGWAPQEIRETLPLFGLQQIVPRTHWGMGILETEDRIVIGLLNRGALSYDEDEPLIFPPQDNAFDNLFTGSAPFDQQWIGAHYQERPSWSGSPKSIPP